MRKLLYLSTLLALAACSENDFEAGREGMVPINLTVDMADAVVTRAGTAVQSTQFAQGETFNAYFPSDNTTVTTTTYKTSNTSGATTCTGTQPYFNAGATSTTVRAFYPSSVTYTSNSFSVQQAQNTDANYKLSDLMYAQNTLSKGTATTATASMTFNHKLSKIVVNATAGSGVSKITDVRIIGGYRTINISTPATCTLGSSLSNANSTSSYITMYSGGTSSTANCAAIIPPQTINGNFLQIVTDKGTATYALSGKAVASGYVYTIGVTVNAAAVGTTTTVTDWGSSASLTIQPTVTKLRAVITPEGAIPGLFTINADGDQVFFSKGNLQYQASTSTWRFAAHQYDYVGDGTNGKVTGSTNASISSSYSGWIDLFGWGTSGWNNGNAFYQPYSSSSDAAPSSNGYGYGPTNGSTYTYSLTDTYANADWGVYNAISNGGNSAGLWRTLTKDEWVYLFNGRTVNNGQGNGKSYTRGQKVNGVLGVVLYPDDYTGAAYTTGSNWSTFESAGCVFLPAAGSRSGASVYDVGSGGNYWSSSAYETGSAYYVYFNSGSMDPAMSDPRDNGFSVRLVRPAWYKEMSSATSSDIGKIICSNGHIHTNVSDVACGGTASAMIAYVGNQNNANGNGAYSSTCSHGLAVALTDVINTSGAKQTPSSVSTLTWEDAKTACTNYKGSKPSGVTWTLPSAYQWERMLIGCGSSATYVAYSSQSFPTSNNGFGYGNFRMKLTACGTNAQGVYDVQPLYYWLSTEYSSGTSTAWDYTFEASFFYYDGKTTDCYVRAVFAF